MEQKMVDISKKDLIEWKDEIIRHNHMMYEKYRQDVKIIGEGVVALQEKVISLQKRVDTLYEMVAQNTIDIRIIKEDVKIIKVDLSKIKKDLKQKVDREEFSLLEKRVLFLEQKLKKA